MTTQRGGKGVFSRPVAQPLTAYEKWLAEEGIHVFDGLMVPNFLEVPRTPWPRVGGKGAYLQTKGTIEGEMGMYVVEIPPRSALNPERHLYEEHLFAVQGRGSVEIWSDQSSRPRSGEWGKGSVLAPPMNAWHRLINAGSEPAILLGVTNAPEMIDLYRNFDFIFNCDFTFHERFIGDDYFAVQPERFTEGWRNAVASNMLVDVWATDLHNTEKKSAGGSVSVFQLGGSTLSGHIAQWPVGMYHKAHAHNPGAILVGLTGTGYFNMWPGELGIHPYEDGNGEMVFEADWGPMSIYSPPDGWYHQHFNTGSTIARHLAFHWGSMWYPRARDIRRHRKDEIMTSVSEGGTMIEYNEEDPEIRRRFEARLKAVGVECLMPPVQT